MNAATHKSHDPGCPAVMRFTARLEQYPGAAKAEAWAMLKLPPEVSQQLGGMANVEGTFNGHPFRAALESNASGGQWLRVNQAMRKGAGAGVGDMVQLAILGPEPEPEVPAEMQAAFSASPTMREFWDDLTLLGRLDWIRWIEGAKQPQTRARRITRTIEQLAEGKRRPCCVNFYEYMLCRVQEDG
jgi:hypothetical protein